jgi:hypothetical protein
LKALDLGRRALAGAAQQLRVNKVLALQRGGQQALDGAPHQQLEGGLGDEQRALDAAAVLDGGAHVVVAQLAAAGGRRPGGGGRARFWVLSLLQAEAGGAMGEGGGI